METTCSPQERFVNSRDAALSTGETSLLSSEGSISQLKQCPRHLWEVEWPDLNVLTQGW